MAAHPHWKSARQEIISKRFAFLGSYPPCPWYRQLKSEFSALVNVTPEEQEHFMNDEVRLFLAGYETENIRFGYGSDSDAPISLRVNPSLDPFMRSAVERFKNILIDIWHIRTYSYDLKHDRSFSLTARAVAYEVVKRLNELLQRIIEGDDYDLADYGLNTLSRNVSTVKSSIKVYADVVKAVKKDGLIGGQVLTMLHRARENAVVSKDIQDLSEIFEVAWKIFASRIGIWVEQGLVDDCELEFIIWPTSALSSSAIAKITSASKLKLDSKDYILVEDLCPSFLMRLLPSIAKCGNYIYMLEKAQVREPLSVDWAKLDIIGLQRKVQEIEKAKSAMVLKQLRTAIPFDSAIRDTMTLLLKARDLDVLIRSKESILYRPVEEVSKQQLRRLSDAFIKGLAVKFPFVSNFKLSYSTSIVFEELRAFGLIVDAPKEPLPTKEQPIALDLLTLTYTPPAKMGKLIPIYVVSLYVFVFRVCLQLHAAINCLSDAMFELGLTRDPGNFRRAAILTSLHRNVLDLTVSIADAVTRAIMDFENEMAKADSIDAVLRLQKDVVHQIFKESRLDQWKKVAYLQRLVDLISSHGVNGLLHSTSLSEDYYVILEEVESMQLIE
ncbi:hypothetical protein Y032_0020g136 [Ancylostoma ceylanicum]|uniref:Gamma-tubulin complex component n=1 Tax=Ancylostoma ceylanicum TaxID=53326 RepID=A0A016V1M5_9BILA|nr:hypothetical protein Y032_0020g136 [Ancylostoma ceylanicum]